MTEIEYASRDRKQSGFKRLLKNIKRDKYLLLMFLPILIYYVMFKYLPMTGIILAFKDFLPGHGIYFGEWVGIRWFVQFFNSPFAARLIRNTVVLSCYHLIFSFPIPIIFAICVTEIRNMGVRRTLQTVSYLPHFISTVVMVGMMKNMFALNNGVVNVLLKNLGHDQISFFQDPGWFRPLHVGSAIWQWFGWNSIIYISSISGIDPGLYEAGEIDGITRFGRAWHITLPMLIPTIVIMFIMDLGSLMSIGFEKVFLMYSPATYETADVISTYVYRKGIGDSEYSFSTAVDLFNSLVNFSLVFITNRICRMLTGSSLW